MSSNISNIYYRSSIYRKRGDLKQMSLKSRYSVFKIVLDTQVFLQPQLVYHTEHRSLNHNKLFLWHKLFFFTEKASVPLTQASSIIKYSAFLAQQPPVGHGLLIHEFFRSHKRRTTVGRTPLDEWSSRRRALYLTTAPSGPWPPHSRVF
jgi:hypothetical protein